MLSYINYCLIFCFTIALADASEDELKKFEDQSAAQYGDIGTRACKHLIGGMPSYDKERLKSEFLFLNLKFAYQARLEFPWCKKLSEEQFFNDVLPYAVLDETRENWRPKFYTIAKGLVKNAKTSSEAAQILNRDFFNIINVHYNTGRKKPNQSPSESIASGKATCSGLSIILTYACRAVGIPARVVGTPLWIDGSGNHTWVEIWDGKWKFLGADEYDAKGLNRGWFVDRASKAIADNPRHAIWATTWTKTQHHFPIVWDKNNHQIHAINVTERYAKNPTIKGSPPKAAIRVFKKKGGERTVAEISLLDENNNVLTTTQSLAGRADLNDVAHLKLNGKAPWTILIKGWGYEKKLILKNAPTKTLDVVLEDGKQPFDFTDIIKKWQENGLKERQHEIKNLVVRADGDEMKYDEKKFGEEPADGHALWISLHGGGGAPARVNDQQWRNQTRLYQPSEGYYVAPRAPSNTWNLWHRKEIDPLLDRLISNFVICRGVNPDRIYLMGYSAGGDGVYQLATRMADRFAAASMMAGHPNETTPVNLRNLPFEIFMGAKDTAYKRNEHAARWSKLLANLRKNDPNGYPHRVTIYPGLGHWMNRRDAESLTRMIKHRRKTWPKKIVWKQDDVTHQRFYWLGIQPENAQVNRLITAEVNGQTISINGENLHGIKLWLSDELINLDAKITVKLNGKEVFKGLVKRDKAVVSESLKKRSGMIATALLHL